MKLFLNAGVVLLTVMFWSVAAASAQEIASEAQESASESTDSNSESESNDDNSESEATDDNPAAGHSYHGEAFNEGPRQQAYLMPGTGKVRLSATTDVPRAQEFFKQGVGQLHGFWYFEAERSFRQVVMLDPDCAMAYWGLAVSNTNNRDRAKKFIQKAVELKENASRREQMWIESLAEYYAEGKKSNKDRRRQYVRALEAIIQEFPDEIDAKAMLALAMWQNSNKGWPIGSHQAVDALIDQVLEEEPYHPVHHFRIHLWDHEKPERALASAALCGQSAPNIAHMWHMPGHIYSRVKRYADACWQQEASARVDHAHMVRDRILPDQIHNYAHNNEWLIRNLSNVGRVQDAIRLAKNMIELPQHPKYNSLSRGGQNSAKYGRDRLFQVLSRYEMWEELIDLADTMYLQPTDLHGEQVKRLRALGVAQFGTGDVEAGQTSIADLEGLLRAKQEEQTCAGKKAADEAGEKEDVDEKKIAKARRDAEKKLDRQINPVKTALSELRALGALADGNHEEAAELIAKVKGLPRDRLARIHLELDNQTEAERLASEEVDGNKNEVQPLANQAYILHRFGKQKQAAEVFEKLRALSANVDLDAPAFERLSPLAAELGYDADWRLPVEVADDTGDRPDLESLGPFAWHPTAAPDWTLPDAEGQPLSLSGYRQGPTVVIFYLGFGCLHCVDQLNTFAPMTDEFADSGIRIVAISSDDAISLKKSVEACDLEGGFPFPLVSDPDYNVFKEYRAFDDFENQPLHGTFLIDAEGLVRWHDISYEPFEDAEFLLQEARRLLNQVTVSRAGNAE